MWVKTDLKSAGGRNRETFLMIWVMRKSEKRDERGERVERKRLS